MRGEVGYSLSILDMQETLNVMLTQLIQPNGLLYAGSSLQLKKTSSLTVLAAKRKLCKIKTICKYKLTNALHKEINLNSLHLLAQSLQMLYKQI